MEELSTLKQYLIQSIKKNGNQPLTLQHLVNIIGLMELHEDYLITKELDDLEGYKHELYADQCGDRD